MKSKFVGLSVCIVLIIALLPSTATGRISCSTEAPASGPQLDFLFGPGAIGWNIVIWNYGDEPASFVSWEIETKGVNGTLVLNGHRRGIIPVLRPKDTQYMAPLNFPRMKRIIPIGFGAVEITVRVYCTQANYDVSFTTDWYLQGVVLNPMFQHP